MDEVRYIRNIVENQVWYQEKCSLTYIVDENAYFPQWYIDGERGVGVLVGL